MRFYILNSFRDIHCQNVPKTFGTPCISLKRNRDLKNFRFSDKECTPGDQTDSFLLLFSFFIPKNLRSLRGTPYYIVCN